MDNGVESQSKKAVVAEAPSYESFVRLQQEVQTLKEELDSLRDAFHIYTDRKATGGS